MSILDFSSSKRLCCLVFGELDSIILKNRVLIKLNYSASVVKLITDISSDNDEVISPSKPL